MKICWKLRKEMKKLKSLNYNNYKKKKNKKKKLNCMQKKKIGLYK